MSIIIQVTWVPGGVTSGPLVVCLARLRQHTFICLQKQTFQATKTEACLTDQQAGCSRRQNPRPAPISASSPGRLTGKHLGRFHVENLPCAFLRLSFSPLADLPRDAGSRLLPVRTVASSKLPAPARVKRTRLRKSRIPPEDLHSDSHPVRFARSPSLDMTAHAHSCKREFFRVARIACEQCPGTAHLHRCAKIVSSRTLGLLFQPERPTSALTMAACRDQIEPITPTSPR